MNGGLMNGWGDIISVTAFFSVLFHLAGGLILVKNTNGT